jgi:predicted transcriptional regulator
MYAVVYKTKFDRTSQTFVTHIEKYSQALDIVEECYEMLSTHFKNVDEDCEVEIMEHAA